MNISRRQFLGSSVLALCIPSVLFAQDKNSDVILRFAACSDVHFDQSHTEKSPQRVRFAKMMQFMNAYSASQPYDRFDALAVAGDFSNHGLITEIGPFRRLMDENLKPETKRVLCMGNHEFYGGNRELWEKLLALLAPNAAHFYLVKGHQKLKEGGARANSQAFKHYKEQNPEPGEKLTYKRFAQIVDHNNRCDALANVFIKENRITAEETSSGDPQ